MSQTHDILFYRDHFISLTLYCTFTMTLQTHALVIKTMTRYLWYITLDLQTITLDLQTITLVQYCNLVDHYTTTSVCRSSVMFFEASMKVLYRSIVMFCRSSMRYHWSKCNSNTGNCNVQCNISPM